MKSLTEEELLKTKDADQELLADWNIHFLPTNEKGKYIVLRFETDEVYIVTYTPAIASDLEVAAEYKKKLMEE